MSEDPGDERRPGNGHRGAERPQLIAKAWKLRTHCSYTFAQIARELGVSQPTAIKYVEEGEEAEGHLPFLDIALRREQSVAALDFWKSEISTRYMRGALAIEKAFPLWLAADDAIAKRIGANAPVKVQHSDGPDPMPSRETLEAVRRTQREIYDQIQEEGREIERRWSGDDDPH